jgi:hypothetical protein
MAEKKEAEGKRKPKKKHLHQIITTKAHDGTFGHEHVYKDKPEDHHTHPAVFAGTSHDIGDVQQHMEDHFGDGAQAEEQGDGEAPEAAGAGGAPGGAGAGGGQAEEV